MRINEAAQRQDLLKNILIWEGRLNRSRVQYLFKIGNVRSSQWIQEFSKRFTNWLKWDAKTKSHNANTELYEPGRHPGIRKLEDSVSLSKYLALVGIPHATPNAEPELLDKTDRRIIWSAYPDFSTPNPGIFSILFGAIRDSHQVEIVYRSMRESKPHNHIISPHNLIRAGRRWHVRAFCSTNQDYRDYALGRISAADDLKTKSTITEKDDNAWMTKVMIRIVAHPDLSIDQEELIRFEYFNDTSARVESCRGALVPYVVQDLRAATDVKKQRPPDYQLAISNIQEVKPWLFPV
jgi:WYL domain